MNSIAVGVLIAPRTKQYMSDEEFKPLVILHCPQGLIRDITEVVPLSVLVLVGLLQCLYGILVFVFNWGRGT